MKNLTIHNIIDYEWYDYRGHTSILASSSFVCHNSTNVSCCDDQQGKQNENQQKSSFASSLSLFLPPPCLLTSIICFPSFSRWTFSRINANIRTTTCSRTNTMCVSIANGCWWYSIHSRWHTFDSVESACTSLSSVGALGKFLSYLWRNTNHYIMSIPEQQAAVWSTRIDC